MTDIQALDALIDAGYGDIRQEDIPRHAYESITGRQLDGTAVRRKGAKAALQGVSRIDTATRKPREVRGALKRGKLEAMAARMREREAARPGSGGWQRRGKRAPV